MFFFNIKRVVLNTMALPCRCTIHVRLPPAPSRRPLPPAHLRARLLQVAVGGGWFMFEIFVDVVFILDVLARPSLLYCRTLLYYCMTD